MAAVLPIGRAGTRELRAEFAHRAQARFAALAAKSRGASKAALLARMAAASARMAARPATVREG